MPRRRELKGAGTELGQLAEALMMLLDNPAMARDGGRRSLARCSLVFLGDYRLGARVLLPALE
jgi:hypothetical protein